MRIIVYTDGAARGNPGRSASGFYAFDSGHTLLMKKVIYNGVKTNNYAEYNAIINALKEIGKQFGYDNYITVYSDSQLAVNQMNGTYRVKNEEIEKLHRMASEEAGKFKGCRFVNLRREDTYISQVDMALNRLLDRLELEGAKGKKLHGEG